jgi:ubiquinone/menaquinone biosynthesis C-methylase UbiE
MPMDAHKSRILDQFTRQAEPFAQSQAIRNQAALKHIVAQSQAGPDDTSLDVACGPGLLACAFAHVVRQAAGIDLTPAMLDQARQAQLEQSLANVSWQQGDVNALPYPDAHFSIVSSRYVFHHLPEPLVVLKEMGRVCKPRGRVVVADMVPSPERAAALNAEELLRDPSHARALTESEFKSLFAQAGLPEPVVSYYRVESEMEDLLSRSFPNPGDADRVRQMFEESLADNALDLNTRRENDRIVYSFPQAILVSTKPK